MKETSEAPAVGFVLQCMLSHTYTSLNLSEIFKFILSLFNFEKNHKIFDLPEIDLMPYQEEKPKKK